MIASVVVMISPRPAPLRRASGGKTKKKAPKGLYDGWELNGPSDRDGGGDVPSALRDTLGNKDGPVQRTPRAEAGHSSVAAERSRPEPARSRPGQAASTHGSLHSGHRGHDRSSGHWC